MKSDVGKQVEFFLSPGKHIHEMQQILEPIIFI